MADAGGVTLVDKKGGGGAGCPIIRDFDGDGTSLNTILDAMQTSIEEGAIVDGLSSKQLARATYDFAVDGGAISTIGLGVTLPDNAIVTRSWYEVITTFTSATDAATVALTIPTDDVAGILAAVAISTGTPFDAGYHEGIQDGTAVAFAVKTTAARELSLTIAVEEVTAGKMILFCEYVVTE